MRGKIITALAATLLTITAGVVAQTSGFPSRPRFSAIGVARGPSAVALIAAGSNANTLPVIVAHGAAATGGQVIVRGAATTAANMSYVEFQDDAATILGYVGDGSSGTSDITLRASTAGANVLLNPGSGGSVLANGAPVLTGRVASCEVSLSGTVTNNVAGCGSATRNSTGVFTVNFSPAFGTANACVAYPIGAAGTVNQASRTTAALQVQTRNSAGTLTDLDFSIMCYGN